MNPGDERAYWDREATIDPLRAAWAADGDGVQECLDQLVPTLLEPLRGGPGLDVGCGAGRLLFPLARMFPESHLYGVDSSANMIDALITDGRAVEAQNVSVYVNDGRAIDPKNQDFTGIMAAAWSVVAFQHMDDETMVGYFGEISRCLRRGGVFRFQFCDGDLPSTMFSHWRTAEFVEKWLGTSGLETVAVDKGRIYPEWSWMTAVKP